MIVKDYLQAVPEYDDTDKFKDGPEQIKEIYETTLAQLNEHCNLIDTQFRDTHYDRWTPKPTINTYEVNDFARKVLLEQMFKNTSLGAELDMLKRQGSVKLNSFQEANLKSIFLNTENTFEEQLKRKIETDENPLPEQL